MVAITPDGTYHRMSSSTHLAREEAAFHAFYALERPALEQARVFFKDLLQTILAQARHIDIAKIESRVKDRDECLRKFSRKYRTTLEESGVPYEIRPYITDLIGVRVVCLYEDELEKVAQIVQSHFDVIDVTDKVSAMEGTEASFGYKGLHLDLRLNAAQAALPQHAAYVHQPFELQVRTIIQDAWSVLDHKIKYKKSIPAQLKRRINVLSALFELADREFLQIRNETNQALALSLVDEDTDQHPLASNGDGSEPLDAFSFVAFGQRHFPGYDFDPQKVEFFIDELHNDFGVRQAPWLFGVVQKHISAARHYKADFQHRYPSSSFNPFTIMRHCLYLEDRQRFRKALRNSAREAFEDWLEDHHSAPDAAA